MLLKSEIKKGLLFSGASNIKGNLGCFNIAKIHTAQVGHNSLGLI